MRIIISFILFIIFLILVPVDSLCYRHFDVNAPLVCRGLNSSCCFEDIQRAISATDCNSDELYLDGGVYSAACLVYNLDQDTLHFIGRNLSNPPIILGGFEVSHTVNVLNNVTFKNIIWNTSRAFRMRGTAIKNLEFTNCQFLQANSSDAMVKFDNVTLEGNMVVKDCLFSTQNFITSSTSSWAEFMLSQHLIEGTDEYQGSLTFDNATFIGSYLNNSQYSLMEIDVSGAKNFIVKNSKFTRGATLYLSDSLNVTIEGTYFKHTGITSTTSSNITIKDCTFDKIQLLDSNRSPYGRCIHFKDASRETGSKVRWVTIRDNTFMNFIKPEKFTVNLAALSFSASPARIYFDKIDVHRNKFFDFNREGLYSIMDEDFDSHVINAQYNWWGSKSGPNDGCNPNGKGANIFWEKSTLRTNVDYRPWCTDENCIGSVKPSRKCPWPAYTIPVLILIVIAGVAIIIAIIVFVRYFYLNRAHHILKKNQESMFGEVAKKRLKAVHQLFENSKFPVRRIPFQDIKLGEVLGEGTFGTVYKAEYHERVTDHGFFFMDDSTQNQHIGVKTKPVAIKSLKQRWINNTSDEIFHDFLNEIRLLSLVEHPNVQGMIGIAIDTEKGDQLYMVSEWMENGSLRSLLGRHQLDPVIKADLSLDIAYGMAHLHSKAKGVNIVHRDLKPENVLVSGSWVGRVADFGTSVATLNEIRIPNKVGTTAYYLSPEALNDGDYSEKSDIFAYGVTLYELWAEEYSYPDVGNKSIERHIRDIFQSHKRPALPMIRYLPHTIKIIIDRCTELDPENRPGFEEIIDLLLAKRHELRKFDPKDLKKNRKSSLEPMTTINSEAYQAKTLHEETDTGDLIQLDDNQEDNESLPLLITDDTIPGSQYGLFSHHKPIAPNPRRSSDNNSIELIPTKK